MILSYGYMTVLNDNIYYGYATNDTGKTVCNGAILKYDAETMQVVIPTSEDFANTTLRIVEETEIYGGLKALRINVESVDPLICFVDNQWGFNDDEAYDLTEYTISTGERMRIHPLSDGEEFVVGPYTKQEDLIGKTLTIKEFNDLQPDETPEPESTGWMIVAGVQSSGGSGVSDAELQRVMAVAEAAKETAQAADEKAELNKMIADEMVARLDDAEYEITTLTTNLSDAEAAIKTLSETLDSVSETANSAKSTADSLNQSMQMMANDIADLKAAIDKLDDVDTAELEEKVKAIDADLSLNMQRVDDMTARLDDLEMAVDAIDLSPYAKIEETVPSNFGKDAAGYMLLVNSEGDVRPDLAYKYIIGTEDNDEVYNINVDGEGSLYITKETNEQG